MMVPQIAIQKTVYKVSDFLGWQRDDALVLSPSFQRRPVWKPIAKSFLIDTIVRGFPVPVIYIRERVDLDTQRTVREVVDGQQRLRTILSFVAPKSLADFDAARDEFVVRSTHNSDIADKPFNRLSPEVRSAILGYEFSVHILASGTEDRDILQMFSRINSTGTKLTPQELRNAQFFGAFKTTMYRLSFQQLDRWRSWGIFSEYQIARMKEAELTSDLVMNMMGGLIAKRQPTIDKWYATYDESFDVADEISRRFERVFDELSDKFDSDFSASLFSGEVLFFSLAMLTYDLIFGIGSRLAYGRGTPLSSTFRQRVLTVDEDLRTERVPKEVLDAIRRAPVDAARRITRHNYLKSRTSDSPRK
jgi:hypothetical protein